jgi:DNA repair protein RecO (recombination protein O)
MPLLDTEAIVLRTYNLGEADRIVVCLTRGAGLVRAVARGARRMKSRFGAALEPFTLLRLSFYERENRELVTINETEILRSRFELAGSEQAPRALAHVAEMVMEFAPPREVNEKLFRMVAACVDTISVQQEDVEPVLRYFDIWMLRLAGFLPDFTRCADCRRPLGEGAYLNGELQARCAACSKALGGKLAAETIERLVASRRLAPGEFARSSGGLSPQCRRELAELTEKLVARVLERPLRRARFVRA